MSRYKEALETVTMVGNLPEVISQDSQENQTAVFRASVTGLLCDIALSLAVIADKLFISVATVKTHIQNMKNRTGFRNRTELAIKARESGLVISDNKTEI